MKRIKAFALAWALGLSAASAGLSLDVQDVQAMLGNGVGEDAVINVLQTQKLARAPTAQEIIALSRVGASERLLEQVTSPANLADRSDPPAAVVTAAPIVVSPPATPQPEVVVASPPPVVYYYPSPYYYAPPPRRYYHPRRPGPIFSFSFGNRHHGRRPPRHRR